MLMTDIQSTLEIIQSDRFAKFNYYLCMNMLGSDDREVGVLTASTNEMCTPCDPANFLRTLQMIGDTALIFEDWSPVNVIVTEDPNSKVKTGDYLIGVSSSSE